MYIHGVRLSTQLHSTNSQDLSNAKGPYDADICRSIAGARCDHEA